VTPAAPVTVNATNLIVAMYRRPPSFGSLNFVMQSTIKRAAIAIAMRCCSAALCAFLDSLRGLHCNLIARLAACQ
jgi:hypothetical protein